MEETDQSAFVHNAKLVAASAARALVVLLVYTVVGVLFHWAAFSLAASDIWSSFDAGPGGAHAGGAAVIFLIVLLFTPPGLVTVLYVLGMPALCFLLGQRMALRAAVHRLLEEKKSALTELTVSAAVRAIAALGVTPGVATASAVAGRARDAVEAMEPSRVTRFVLKGVLAAVRLPEIVSASNLVARYKTEPDTVREEVRAAIEPRIQTLGEPRSFRPLLYVLAFTTVVTLTREWWTRLYAS